MSSPRPGSQRAAMLVLPMTLILVACTGTAPSGTPQAAAPSAPGATSGSSLPAPTVLPTMPAGVMAVLETPFRASGLIEGAGLIWAEDHAETQTVYAIDPATGEVAGSQALGRPCDLVAVDGMVWAADNASGTLVEIDPETFEVGRTVDGLAGPCGPQTTDGALWVAVDGGIARVDLDDLSTTVTELGDAAFPGIGEPMWAMEFGSGALHRMNLRTGASTLDIDAPGGPQEMVPPVVGFDSLWVANAGAGKVFRLDPATGEVQAEVAATVPTRLLATTDAIWASSYPHGTIQRIDPSTNEVVFKVRLGGNLNGLAEVAGSVWVSDTLAGRLYEIDLAAVGIFE